MAESGTVTLLFTDLVSSTQLLERAGDEAGQRMFRAHHKLMTDAITSNGGEELQWLGDGVLAAFSSTADAVRCAIIIQQTARRPIEGARFEIRIGVHVGEALRREDGYFGAPVVIARRLCERAAAGQILCSRLICRCWPRASPSPSAILATSNSKASRRQSPSARSFTSATIRRHYSIARRSSGRSEQLKRLSVKLEEACKATVDRDASG